MRVNRQAIIRLLMLAILLLPGQGVSAQTEMPVSPQKHECPHMQMSQQQDAPQAMECCDQQAGHCKEGCSDCFHCQVFSALMTELRLDLAQSYPEFILPLHETESGLPPTAQFRPPRTRV